MANALQDRIDTEIIVSSYNSNLFVQKIKENNLKYKKLNIRSLSRNKKNIFLYIINFIPELVFLTLYFKRNQFDIIHVSGGAWQIKGVLSGWFARRKIIWHLNDTSMPGFILWVLKILSALPDAFIFSSENTKKYYADKISKSSYLYEVIHPPVNTSRYCDENIAIEPSFKKIIKDKIVIGTVANINPIKGIDVFVKMVAELNKVRNDFLFVVVGKVYENQISYYQKCLDQITNNKINNITFILDVFDVRSHLKSFDIFVCTSFSESGPITLFEALSMSKPVVTTKVGDVADFVIENKNGAIVEPGDYMSMAEKVINILNNKSVIPRYKQKSREIAISKLDVINCAEKHLQIYSDVMKNAAV